MPAFWAFSKIINRRNDIMDWKTKTLLIYSIGGLIIGAAAGIATINNAVEKNEEVDITFKDGARIGVNALNSLSKVILK